jgi:hypothetical protein
VYILKAVSKLKLAVGWSKYNQALGSGKTAFSYTGLVFIYFKNIKGKYEVGSMQRPMVMMMM